MEGVWPWGLNNVGVGVGGGWVGAEGLTVVAMGHVDGGVDAVTNN